MASEESNIESKDPKPLCEVSDGVMKCPRQPKNVHGMQSNVSSNSSKSKAGNCRTTVTEKITDKVKYDKGKVIGSQRVVDKVEKTTCKIPPREK